MSTNEPLKRDPVATRQLLLDVTASIVLEKGLSGLTLDGVAKGAGVSKGGLLHHFPSKQHLIDALITSIHQQFVEKLKRASDADPDEVGKLTRAYLLAGTMDRDDNAARLCNVISVEDRGNQTMKSLWSNFLSSMLDPKNSGGADPVMLAIVRLATDGLWLAELEGVFVGPRELRQAIVQRLEEMTHLPASSENRK